MKTIEEALNNPALNRGIIMSSVKQIAEKSFISGVEFAQQWIDIKDELPEYYHSVLMNFSGGSETFLVWRGFSPEYEEDVYTISGTNRIVNLKPIEWRPIEYK